ncbi:EF-hand calcium-binding domain-containing protein 5 [Phlyctochytrium bullatum]|nr:EF-hand calcium-binding domain-containing protein 5 [Phlyctochytrium bullatum]
MKTSFAEKRLSYKDSKFNKVNVIPSTSAFISDAGELKEIGNSKTIKEESTPAGAKSQDWKELRAISMKEDGYSRSTRPADPLKSDNESAGIVPLSPVREYSLRRRDLAEWVHVKDPHAQKSLSRSVHVALDPLDAVKIAHNKEESRIGTKEPTGAVNNNPKFVYVAEPNVVERFTTETDIRFKPPVDPFKLSTMKCNSVQGSGFTSGNAANRHTLATEDVEKYFDFFNHIRSSSENNSSTSVKQQRQTPTGSHKWRPGDQEVRDAALQALANDFLNVSDLSLDLRAYLIETTLPTTILALEKLIREVERRNLLADDASLTPEGGVALAAEDTKLDPQPDKPPETSFNPITWLAQYLYRNNPRYSNFSEPLVTPYVNSLQQIGDNLKARLFELHTNRRAKMRAEQLAKKREDERTLKALHLKREEKRNLFLELLSTLFKKWSSKNWRMSPGYLLRTEIVDGLRAVLQDDNVQSDDSLINKVSSLLNAFSMAPDISEKARADWKATNDAQQSRAKSALSQGKQWRGVTPMSRPITRNGLFGPECYVPAEFLAMDKWTLEMFAESMLFIMESSNPEWLQEELGVFLQVLSNHIDGVADKLLNEFNKNLVVPKFSKLDKDFSQSSDSSFSTPAPNTPGLGSAAPKPPVEFSVEWAEAIKADWKRRLGRLLEAFMNGEEIDPDLDISEIKASMLDYCNGLVRLDPGTPAAVDGSRAATSTVVSWRPGSVSGSLLGQGVQLYTPDPLGAQRPRSETPNAFETTTGVLPTFGSASTPEQDGEDQDARSPKPENVITLAGVLAEVEEEYKLYLKVIIGFQGIRPYNVMMSYLSRAVMENDARSHPYSEQKIKTVEERIDSLLEAFAAFVGVSYSSSRGNDSKNKCMTAEADILQLQTAINLVLDREGGDEVDPRFRAILERIRDFDEKLLSQRNITGADFAAFANQASGEIDGALFDELVRLLKKEFAEAALTFAALTGSKPSSKPASSTSGSDSKKGIDRGAIEKQALTEIARLARKPTATVPEVANQSLHLITKAFEMLHPAHVVRGRVAVPDFNAKVDSASSPAPRGAEDLQFKYIACSPDISGELLGTPLLKDSDAVEAKALRSPRALKIETGEDNEVVKKIEATTPTSPNSTSKFLGVPLVSPVATSPPKAVGVLGLSLCGEEDGGFNDSDVKFAENCSEAMLEALEIVERRVKALYLAESSLKYARELGDAEVQIYLNEPEKWTDPPKFYQVESYSLGQSFTVDVEEGGKATSRPKSPAIRLMPEEDPVTDLLCQTANEKTLIDFAEADGRITTYIPVIDAEQHVVAVMSVRPLPGNKGEMDPQDLDDVRRISSVLATAIGVISKEKFGIRDDFSLEGESIDDEARKGMLFSKMMLINARELLGKLDNRALAEFRSYKKPPAVIHKVLKAVLYIFGKLPKEVKLWSDTIKHLNADLLKAMISYDPTAIQKKIRFKRCNRVLKRVPRGEVKNRGSVPTMYMHEWLLISLELRRVAVEARNRRPELYQLVQDDGSKDDDGEDDEGDDESIILKDGDGGKGPGSGTSDTTAAARNFTPTQPAENDLNRPSSMDSLNNPKSKPPLGSTGNLKGSPSRSSLKTGDGGISASRTGSRGGLNSGGMGSGEMKRVQFSDRVETSDGDPVPPKSE